MTTGGVRLTGTGSYLPARVLTNAELEKLVATSDEWIRTRTGIRERRLAAPDEPTSALGAEAARRALAAAGRTAAEVDLLIVATITPDEPFPNTGCFVQKRLGAWQAACFSIEAACSGFVYALDVAAALLKHGSHRVALVIGSEKMSSLIDWQDRNTCVLFGDAAGAVVLEACKAKDNGYLGAVLGADGRHTDILHVPGGGTRLPFSQAVLDQRLHYLHMAGPEVFKLAVNNMVAAAQAVLAQSALTAADMRWLIPHQANLRIIRAVGKRLGLDDARVYVNLDRTGNSSAATIPVALDEIVRGGMVQPDDHLMLVAFGGGLTWGASLLRWSRAPSPAAGGT